MSAALHRVLRLVSALSALCITRAAGAGSFDDRGEYHPADDAVAYLDFSSAPERFLPDDAEDKCAEAAYQLLEQPDALDGSGLLRLRVPSGCQERLLVELPAEEASYRATVWVRHGSVAASIFVGFPEDSGIADVSARMFPTGRTTSDGWVELASNEFPVDGAVMLRAYLRISNYADVDGVDLDSLEIVRAGSFWEPQACFGHADPVCGTEAMCGSEVCRLGRLAVPPLPSDELRDEMVDVLASKLRLFFGGKRSRAESLPKALAVVEQMRQAKTAWEFWGLWARAVRELRDWHTNAHLALSTGGGSRRLNACFFEGDADLTHGAWPKDAQYPDILVSHAGIDAAGLAAGDRLVAVDGVHPIAWARNLIDVDLGWHVATDPDVHADVAEQLGGPTWVGGALILRYAKTFSVLRCDAATGTCADAVETLSVADLGTGGGGEDVACDNRPFYHLESAAPVAGNHYVDWNFFRGQIANTTPEEKIFGMVWDTLYGGGDPNGWVNGNIASAIAEWKVGARGVILDHRAGSGGTLDAAENLTKLVRAPEPVAVVRMPIIIGGWDGPADDAEGLSIFTQYKDNENTAFQVGSVDHDPTLPVALITHRDGSASDYLPFGMKGAPKVKIFGPHGTAGAFSTFIEFHYWAGLSFQIASGETIAYDGRALIGHGVEPDVVLLPRQSDLLAGKDTLHEAALAWVRQELKP
jgi:hypothetical protein